MTFEKSASSGPRPLPAPESADRDLEVPLLGLAVLFAWLDVLASRGVLRLVGNSEHRDHAELVGTVSRFVRNVAGVSVVVGLVSAAFMTTLSPRVGFSAARRWILGGLFGLFFPVIAIALVAPESKTSIFLVLIGIAGASSIAFTYAATAFSSAAAIEQRVACSLAWLMSLASIGHIGLQVGTTLLGADSGAEAARACRNITELAYFALPVSLALGLVVRRAPTVPAVRFFPAIVFGVAVVLALRWLAAALPADYNLLLYGALHLEALDSAPDIVYALLVGAGLGAGVLAVTTGVRRDRRVGLGALLVMAAGAGPRTPLTLAMLALGTAAMALSPRHEPKTAAR